MTRICGLNPGIDYHPVRWALREFRQDTTPRVRETVEADIAKVLAACADWTGEREIMRVTGLGKGRVIRALARAGDRLERMAQRRNACFNRWVWRRV